MFTFLHKMELRKLFPILTGIVILLLAAVTALGIKQYLLYSHCEKILDRSNQIIFQFTSIKEHINDSLLTEKTINIQETGKELLGFDQDLKNIIDDILIPEEFKLSFISQVDLMGLIVQLRAIKDNASPPSAEQRVQLTTALRSINNRLFAFHKLLAGYTRSLLLGLYKVIVGTLALVIFFITTMLLLINKFIAVPIVQLCSMADMYSDKDLNKSWHTGTLSTSIQSLTSFITQEQAYKKRFENLRICLDNTLQTLPDSFASQDDWETICSALQTNPDYFLVWVGQYADGDQFPTPVTGCGCVSSSPRQCKQAIEHLIEFCHQEGGLCDTARKALQRGTQMTALTSHEQMPQTLRSSLAIGTQPILSASFPISGSTQAIDTVITVYSTEAESFSALEISVLQLLCRHISHIRLLEKTTTVVSETIPADLYRFSIAGELSTSVANELINLSNGALNYSQALVDLTADDQENDDNQLLLKKLHAEEQKISRLAADLNQLAGFDSTMPSRFSIDRLFRSVSNLMQGQLRQQNIKLQTKIDKDIADISAPVTLVKIVLLTLLHEAQSHIRTLSPVDKKKSISLRAMLHKTQPELLLTITPLRDDIETEEQNITGPWPPMSSCHDMMRSFNGSLSFAMNTSQTSLAATLSIPLQISNN